MPPLQVTNNHTDRTTSSGFRMFVLRAKNFKSDKTVLVSLYT